ncbi:hypothetical protein SAMN05421503_1438 [Terribacillus aidingensis]|uniref:Uncharacterized protein n=1 Tax=Terribacillus aidingensis TaxID=586416 RepID=A0A285NKD7_9BACI|nr:hypothetical protein [Terribacillus aidingensis]SNZ09960.1 hypothetical protein SAMN05421503_1438 [Terribacillus aidingensis]
MSTKQCLKCLRDKHEANFYKSYSKWHTDEKMPWCKDCLKQEFDNAHGDKESMKEILRVCDRPFKRELWEASVADEKDTFGMYFKNISLKKFRLETWADSDTATTNTGLAADFSDEDKKIAQENAGLLVKFWGRGFSMDDYTWLQNEYEDFTSRYQIDSKGMELVIKQICLTQLDIEKRRENKEKVDQQLKTLQDLLGSGNLKPVQETGANAAEQESFGTLLKKWENDKPVPLPDPKWADVDNIGRYIRVFFLGHLSRMLNLKNKYADEYWEEIKKHTVEDPVAEEIDGKS